MIVRNAWIYTPEGTLRKGSLAAEHGTVTELSFSAELHGEDAIDAEGLYAIPGLVDIHLHGAAGADVSDGSAEGLAAMARYELGRGVTTILPAGMTLPERELELACRSVADFRDDNGSRVAGIRLEGPFLSRERCGAQDPQYLKAPDAELLRKLQRASGNTVRIVDIAPELPGATELIENACGTVRFSLAHTDADYGTCTEAFAAGARQVTHLYNGMRPMLHRAPGLPGAAADAENITVELIADGVHLHPATVRNALRLYGAERVVFVSDSMRATGLGNGTYTLGGQQVTVNGNRATLKDGTLAGSVTDLMGCMVTAVKDMGVPLETAVRCCTRNPAAALGDPSVGSLAPGCRADIVLLDKELNIVRVYRGGIAAR
ncbi:MAG: N-acetylglucosamine-6-phosphate deacetylase [Clostridia bacterium]|nr:N-acetylglucosamine-6-phosphate deacetylase [Clostridia bacterium]